MTDMKAIHDFAIKYSNLYANPQTTERDLEEGFANQCMGLEFEMDCSNRFIEAYSSEAFYEWESLDKIIDDIDDIQLLGAAIFSRWRYVTHRSHNSHLLDQEHRFWFIIAFGRLVVITDETDMSSFILEGTLQEIQLISNNVCAGPCPDPEDEVEQHLTISSNGCVRLLRYRYGTSEDYYELIEEHTYNIPSESIESIMTAFTDYFGDEYDIDFADDVGSWNLVLINTEGKKYVITGPLCHDLQTSLGGLSELIRKSLNLDDLFAFDGAAN